MPAKKRIAVDDKVPLKLTAVERKLLLEDLTCLDTAYERAIRDTPVGKPLMMTLDELDDFGGYVAAEANHCDDAKKQRKLDRIFDKVQALLDKHSDADQETLSFEDAKATRFLSEQAVQFAEWAARLLHAGDELSFKNQRLHHFWLAPAQQEVVLQSPGLSESVKQELAKNRPSVTVADVAGMIMVLAKASVEGEPQRQAANLLVANHLVERVAEELPALDEPPKRQRAKRQRPSDPSTLFQFKITLLDIEPAIWRRIQMRDGTLADLHDAIQAAMGWEDCHLHRFEIGNVRYAAPFPDDIADELGTEDESDAWLSGLLPKSGKRTRWLYEYDFGDGWRHEILFEGCPTAEKRKKYPLCLEGERACPPEDVGGPWGYAEYLEALADPEHERHEEFLEWSGPFDPEAFDAKRATREMRKAR